MLQLLFSVNRFYNGIFFMKLHYQNDNNLRDWRANSVVGILLIKKTVSKIHKTINNWLKAVDILGFCNNKIAVKFPMQPKTMTMAETTPVIQYFHRNRCCKICNTEWKLYIKKYKQSWEIPSIPSIPAIQFLVQIHDNLSIPGRFEVQWSKYCYFGWTHLSHLKW